LRRVGQATVQVRNQEGAVVSDTVSNDAGEFSIKLPSEGTYSLSAMQGTLRSEYVVVKADALPATPVSLTLAPATELAIEVVSPLPPLQYRASSETYSLSRKEIEVLPRGNNIDLNELLYTIPSAAQSALKQVHIRQDHANLQLRIDGVPIPDTVTSTFSDVITPRAWDVRTLSLADLRRNTETGRQPSSTLQVRAGRNLASDRRRCSADRTKR
jgi:hypothetical protein